MTDSPVELAPLLATALMALVFVLGGHLHPLQPVVRDRRVLVSFGAGIAAAYLFVGMMPELAEGMARLAEDKADLPQAGLLVYVAALVGFVAFYGLDHSARRAPEAATGAEAATSPEPQAYGYGLYVWLVTYVMVLEAEGSAQATLWYAFAMALHFLTIDHTLRERRGEVYDRRGRFLLALCTLLGWAMAQAVVLTPTMTTLALGFISGALTVNSVIMELSEGSGARFLPFAAGSLFYAALLLGVGVLS